MAKKKKETTEEVVEKVDNVTKVDLKNTENRERAKLEQQKMNSSERQTSMQVGAKKEKPFESKGNDVLGKGVDMSRFGPR